MAYNRWGKKTTKCQFTDNLKWASLPILSKPFVFISLWQPKCNANNTCLSLSWLIVDENHSIYHMRRGHMSWIIYVSTWLVFDSMSSGWLRPDASTECLQPKSMSLGPRRVIASPDAFASIPLTEDHEFWTPKSYCFTWCLYRHSTNWGPRVLET